MFWQNKDDSLTGYKTKEAVERDIGARLVMLHIRLKATGEKDSSGFCNAAADARIERTLAECIGDSTSSFPDTLR